MKKISVLVLCILVTLVVAAPKAAQAADYRIGVVNAVKVLESAPQAEAARQKLEKEFAPRDRQLVAAQKDLKKMEDHLAQDGAIMSQAERDKLQGEVINRRREIKRNQDEFRDDLNFRRNEEFGKIQRLVVDAIQAVAKEDKYDLIMGEGVIYASKRVDITQKVIDRLKQQYKGK